MIKIVLTPKVKLNEITSKIVIKRIRVRLAKRIYSVEFGKKRMAILFWHCEIERVLLWRLGFSATIGGRSCFNVHHLSWWNIQWYLVSGRLHSEVLFASNCAELKNKFTRNYCRFIEEILVINKYGTDCYSTAVRTATVPREQYRVNSAAVRIATVPREQ